MSAVVSTDEIVSAEPFSLPSASSSSYGGSPLAAAAALVTIQTIIDEGLVDNAARIGRLFLDGLRSIAERRRSIANIRGRGLLIGFDLVSDPDTRTPLPKESCVRFFKDCLAEGLIAMSYTPRVRIHPPLVLSAEQVTRALAVFDIALGRLDAAPR